MGTIITQAVYRKGVLKPKEKLDLPEDSLVQVQVTPITSKNPSPKSLFGAFPELATLSSEDINWVIRQWDHSTEKQSRILDGLE
jgi:predicted DNA-binding antitoxin AbrB/MazE fold protein